MFCLLGHAHRGVSVGLYLQNELLAHWACTPATAIDNAELSPEAVIPVYAPSSSTEATVWLSPPPPVFDTVTFLDCFA